MRYALFLLLALSACTPDRKSAQDTDSTVSGGIDSLEAVQEEPQRRENPAGADTTRFEAAFAQFFSALQAGDTAALNQFVDPEQGIWLIEQPGALPAYAHFQRIQDAKRHYQNKPFVSINENMRECALQQRAEFPEFNCAWMDQGKTGYAEDGCFYTRTTDFRNSDMWKYANLEPQQEQRVQQMQQQVLQSVLHTQSYARFHFGYRNGHWRLLFADLRVPCSA